jgi:MYXO-CTERM domain-containing protein
MRRVLASAFVFLSILFVPAFAHAVSTTLVISEFRTRGPNGANDEFVEIFNISNAAINLNGYSLRSSDSAGNTTLLVQAPAYTLQPKHFYLFANYGTQGYSGTTGPNAAYYTGIPDDGGVAIVNQSGVVDSVGMSAGSAYTEGTPLAPLVNSINQSYERNNGGCASTVDTDNNASDFRYNPFSSTPANTNVSCANPCAGVVCKAPPSPCYSNPGTCSNGTCTYAPFTAGAACSDGDACTTGDQCDASLNCVPSDVEKCQTPPANFCSDANTLVTYASTGTCSSSTGCSYSSSPTNCQFGCDGTTKQCKPDPCTSITCNAPPNDCYQPGTGKCVNGACVFTPVAAKTACDDGDQCTSGDSCDGAGKCSGTAVSVDDGEPCTTDACNKTTGITHTPVADNTSCDDGDLCNGIAICQSGKCTNGQPQTCNKPPIGGCYAATGTCKPSDGSCTYQPSTPDTTCDDGDVCTINDKCDGNGQCGGSAVICTAASPTCVDGNTSRTFTAGTCQAGTGNCGVVSSDKHCDFGCDNASGLCKQDPCIGVTCNQPTDQCQQATGTCSNGQCTYAVNVGGHCDDGNSCTSNDTCSSAGACAGTPLACNTPDVPKCKDSTTSISEDASGTCSNATCSYTAKETNCPLGCDSASGLCVGDPCKNVTCDTPPDQCHQSTGTCGTDGKCTYAPKQAGSSCDDGKACTTNDKCDDSGNCAGETACNTPPATSCDTSTPVSHGFDAAGTCDDQGACKYNQVDKGCSAGCNKTSGLCNNDPCTGVTCATPPGSCYNAAGTCGNDGTCSYAARDTTASCDDGDRCTTDDHCDGHGKCIGTASSCGDGGIDGGAGGKSSGAGGASSGGGPSSGGGNGEAGTTGTPDAGTTGPSESPDAGVGPHTGKTTISGGGSGSCGCSVPRSTSSTAWPLGLLALSMLAMRRRKR